jgi:hypothetical protein
MKRILLPPSLLLDGYISFLDALIFRSIFRKKVLDSVGSLASIPYNIENKELWKTKYSKRLENGCRH